MRNTHKYVKTLEDNQIFVFGSNLSGRHGKGAAKTATKWWSVYGQAEGLQGSTYAIPTKNKYIKTLNIDEIKIYVDRFIDFAKQHTEYTFLVTEIGCGLAGYDPKYIAPLFAECENIKNIWLSPNFWKIISK